MFPTNTDFDTKVTLETEMSPVDEDTPFNILFMGDWSGTKIFSEANDKNWRPVEVDRDNFDDVMRKFQVRLELRFDNSGNVLNLEFNELDDFHPDRIFEKVSLFSNLRDIRRKLKNQNTYNEAAAEVRSWIKTEAKTETVESEVTQGSAVANDGASVDLLDQILGQGGRTSAVPRKSGNTSSELSDFVSNLVKPHIIQTNLEEQSNLLMIVDELTSDLMRKILHHPQFQSLESAWRGIYLLVRKIETGNDLKVFLLDISKEQLADDLKAVEDLTDSRTYRIMRDFGKSWAVAGGNYSFGLNVEDAAILIRLAKIGFDNNVPFVSYIKPEMFDVKYFDESRFLEKLKVSVDTNEAKIWNALRSLPEATHLGLALPRFLARLPYGERTEPTEVFAFEEFTDSANHESYLWANPAFLCIILLAQTYSNVGWEFSSNLVQNFDGLPVHYYQDETETKAKSCAEISMTQTNAEILIDQGLMPLISFKDTDKIRIGRFQSITFSESMLEGKWN